MTGCCGVGFSFLGWFQYRKRYEVTCDTIEKMVSRTIFSSFNTASGMRSHVTSALEFPVEAAEVFQYRKRYEVTCDFVKYARLDAEGHVSIPQAV